ncbi:MAG: nuclear transport factor 2 family protein [Saprospiraceae bacterium]|nr:nuclear transport factor 2 family protein [Saprospiraceae bacterium]
MKPLTKTMGKVLSIWKNVSLDFLKAYQDHSVESMVALCHKNSTVSFTPLGEDGKGTIQDLGKTMWTYLMDSFPDIDNTVHSVSHEEGKIIAKVSIRGTQAKDFAGISNKGHSFDSEHIFVFTMDDSNEINHININWDHTDFQRQLGV